MGVIYSTAKVSIEAIAYTVRAIFDYHPKPATPSPYNYDPLGTEYSLAKPKLRRQVL